MKNAILAAVGTIMAKIVLFVNVTLDGVMQAPARPDEDPRGGFRHGGWATPFNAMQDAPDAMKNVGALLLGRRTYEDFHNVWPHRKESPFSAFMDNIPKYVASRTLKEPLPWKNSHLLEADAAGAVARLKKPPGKDIVIMGSGDLVQSLMRANLIDDYVLLFHPLVLGSGRRLFPDGGAPATLQLVEGKTTPRGVLAATYRPAAETESSVVG